MSSFYRNSLRIALFIVLLAVIFENSECYRSRRTRYSRSSATRYGTRYIPSRSSIVRHRARYPSSKINGNVGHGSRYSNNIKTRYNLADSRRGGGARFGSRFRSRYSSTRIRQRYGTSVRIRHGYSRFGGSSFQHAMTAGLIFGLMSNYQRRRYYRRNTHPTVCKGQPTARPQNSTKIQYFICPEENMPDNLRYCCGASLSEHCCDDSSHSSGGSKAGMIIGIIGAVACGFCIISTVIFVCKKKAAQPGAIILKPTTENQTTITTYPSVPSNYQAQAPMVDPKDVPAYPAAQYPQMPQPQPIGMHPQAAYPTAPNPEAPPYPGAGMPTMPPYPVSNQPPPYSQ